MKEKLRIGILISGGGTNMQAIVNACRDGLVDADVVFVGADNPDAGGLVWARGQEIPTFVVDYRVFRDNLKHACLSNDYSNSDLVQAVFEKSVYVHELFNGDKEKQLEHICWKVVAETELLMKIREAKIDLLVLAGFMQICTSYLIDNMNQGDDMRIMNIHPALLPAFPGTDGYSDTFRHGCRVGGCTVHFVDYGEDSGPIIGQRTFPIYTGDTLDEVKKRGLQEEYLLFPACIQLFAEKRLQVVKNDDGRKVVWIADMHNHPNAI